MDKTADQLREEIDLQRAEISRDLDALGDRVSPGRIIDRRTEAVRSRFRGAKDAVMGSNADEGDGRLDQARDKASGLVHTAADDLTGVPSRIRSTTEGNPLAVGLVAFGIGLVAATLIPTTRREEQLAEQLQPQLEKAGAQVGRAGRELVENLRPDVEEAVAHVQDQASQSGAQLAGEAKDAVSETAQVARA